MRVIFYSLEDDMELTQSHFYILFQLLEPETIGYVMEDIKRNEPDELDRAEVGLGMVMSETWDSDDYRRYEIATVKAQHITSH